MPSIAADRDSTADQESDVAGAEAPGLWAGGILIVASGCATPFTTPASWASPAALQITIMLMYLAGTFLLGSGLFAKMKQRANRRFAIPAALLIGLALMIVIPLIIFFVFISSHIKLDPGPYMIAVSVALTSATSGLALTAAALVSVVASLAGYAKRRLGLTQRANG